MGQRNWQLVYYRVSIVHGAGRLTSTNIEPDHSSGSHHGASLDPDDIEYNVKMVSSDVFALSNIQGAFVLSQGSECIISI